ncbi:MAG: N-acetylmuramoyl-L-alanine amidase family protein [Candidatus Limnocylindria bacterium]
MNRWVPSLALAVALLTAACSLGDPNATPRTTSEAAPVSAPPPIATPSSEPDPGTITAAPGSTSAVYEPNPGAIVVAIDAGHGGCLDWGVPDPSERGVELAEKTLTLEIARRLRDLLTAEGVGVVMIRDADEALAGDDYPPLGCDGPPWRDVNGDGLSGFGPDVPEATRTRDELQARLDLANLSGADALVSIHINSPSDGGERIAIAFSETFYTDETPWGVPQSQGLAQAVEDGVVDRLSPLADYDRGDRGITAHNLYIVAPPLFEPTEERPDPSKQPTRGGLMPVVLAEVGSITLRAEHDLLASADGQDAVARGLMDGVAHYLAARDLSARIGLADAPLADTPPVADGDGPPYWATVVTDGPIRLRLTNNGTAAWPAGLELVAGLEVSVAPYLARPPTALEPLAIDVPRLGPGESVVVVADIPLPPSDRGLAWISLRNGSTTTADLGIPALQVATQGR